MTDFPREKPKIFCIGLNKTGTTSLTGFLEAMGIDVGAQRGGETLIKKWALREFYQIICLAETAQFFQDIPFSLPFTYQALDMWYPDSKFILTVRESSQHWYESLVRFHMKVIGKGRVPTADDLREFPYVYKGWLFDVMTLGFGVSEEEPYDKGRLIQSYELHNKSVENYFSHRKESLLTINLAEPGAARRIAEFVGLEYGGQPMPHLNRSSGEGE